jgi:hypothetical protein
MMPQCFFVILACFFAGKFLFTIKFIGDTKLVSIQRDYEAT